MLPAASDSVAHSRHTQHDHTSSRFTITRNIILNQGGFGGADSFHVGAERGI